MVVSIIGIWWRGWVNMTLNEFKTRIETLIEKGHGDKVVVIQTDGNIIDDRRLDSIWIWYDEETEEVVIE
jgi:hypothetical protein